MPGYEADPSRIPAARRVRAEEPRVAEPCVGCGRDDAVPAAQADTFTVTKTDAVAWQSLRAYGFDVGAAELKATLDAGSVRFATVEAAFGQTGKVRLEPSVRLTQAGYDLTFEVTDDGAGFDPESRGYGTGLQGMADRLHAHGGSLDVRSAPGAGTTVVGWLPSRVLEAAG